MPQSVSQSNSLDHIDKRLSRIQTLLEEGNQNMRDSRQEITEEIGHLHDKVDRVQDTVTFIKKKISTFTPMRLGLLIIIAFGIWVLMIYYFHLHDRST